MRTVLVTGASRGIGAATARLLRAQGFFVYLHGRDSVALAQLERELGQSESVLTADLGTRESVTSLIDELTAKLRARTQKLTALVNNAGIYHRHESAEGRADLWDQQFRVNLLGPAQLTEGLIPLLTAAAPSCIVNVSSTLGLRPVAGVSAYSASKAAMINWTHSLALELGPKGIRANVVCPGIVDTPIHDFHELPPSEKTWVLNNMANLQPLGRIGQPADIAAAIAFLISDASSWTTGATLSVDGGINLK